MDLLNLSSEPEGRLRSWLPHDLEAERVVFLPDACPGKSPLPTGTVVKTRQTGWRRYAVSDCGCGMRLLRSDLRAEDLTQRLWDAIAEALRANKGNLGDLGGGNHFLDALQPVGGGALLFLVHTGSRRESGHVDVLIDRPFRFDEEFERVTEWASANRAAVQAALESFLGPLGLVLDLPHNTYESLADGSVIIRKGAVRCEAGDLNVIPSHIAGEVALVRATDRIAGTLWSLSHGTGRAMPRAEAKELAAAYDFDELRKSVMFPSQLADASLRSEGPYAYRELDACLESLGSYISVEELFRVIAYMGHL